MRARTTRDRRGLGFTITPGAGGGYTPSLPEAPTLVAGSGDSISAGTYQVLSQMIWGPVVGAGSAPVQGAVRQGYIPAPDAGQSLAGVPLTPLLLGAGAIALIGVLRR